MVAVMPLLKQVYVPFLYGLPTINRSCVSNKYRAVGEERGQGRSIVVVYCLVILLGDRFNLLDYFGSNVSFFSWLSLGGLE
jgi:hypothetical protein